LLRPQYHTPLRNCVYLHSSRQLDLMYAILNAAGLEGRSGMEPKQ